MIWFAPHLLSSHALEARGDDDLPDGLHLRLVPAAGLGLPLTPFLVYPLGALRDARPAQLVEAGDGSRRALLSDPDRNDGVPVAAHAYDHGEGTAWLAALHRDGLRVAARRSVPPLIVAAPLLDQLRVPGEVEAVQIYRARPTDLEKLVAGDSPHPPLGLPVPRRLAWFAGGMGREAGRRRVEEGAPRRLSPVDRPDGPLPPATPDDEWARLADSADDLDALLRAALDDPDRPPGAVVATLMGTDDRGAPTSAASPVLTDILLRAMDPGAARYLGLAAWLKDLRPPARERPAPPVLGAVALFAVPGHDAEAWRRLGLGPPAETEGAIARFARLFPGVERVVELARARDQWVGAVSTIAAAPPPPDLPVVPGLSTRGGRWVTNAAGGAFAQGFVVARPPLAPLVAVSRREEGAWISRHGPEDAPRRYPRLLGTRVDPAPPPGQVPEVQGLVQEDPIPAASTPRYRLRLGDLFGRYGPPVECDPSVPPRPAPPPPVPQVFVRRTPVAPGASEPVSPGTLEIRLPVPPPGDLALGALPIEHLEIGLGGVSELRAAAEPEMTLRLPLQALAPTEVMELELVLRFRDAAGTTSDPFVQRLRIADARPPLPIPYGYGLFWTSRPGPAGEVEAALRWPAPVGQRHRVYVADAAGLGLEGGTRAEVADAGVRRARNGHVTGPETRRAFRLLTEAPVVAGPDGRATLRAALPRALRTVQFLRVVPIGPDGVEADFDACGLAPVAVPDDRPPPPPRLRALPGGDAGAPSLSVEAVGLNLALLEDAEPGLFAEPPDPAGRPPEYRLRRASGPVPDPVYAREVARGPLTRQGDAVFAAVVAAGDGLAAYLRYTYWAEVRMPPERRVLAEEAAPAGAAEGLSHAQKMPCPGVWSPISAPVTVVAAPPTPPDAPAATDVEARLVAGPDGLAARLTVRGAPKPGPGGGWHLRVWRGWDGAPLEQAEPDTYVLAGEVTWGEAAPPGARALDLAVALVDPLGRQGAVRPARARA